MLKTVQFILIGLIVAGVGYFGYKYFFDQSQGVDMYPNISATEQYENASLGLAFTYDSKYKVQEQVNEDMLTLVLLKKDYVPPQNGEGPPTISIQAVPSDLAKLQMDEWLPEVQAKGITLQKDMLLATTTAAHREAYLFRTDGLYAGYATVIKAGARAYVFSVSYVSIEDEILNEYAKLLSTVEIN